MDSRHTVNWDIHAYDPRTHNLLPLIPDGELATVRLGNWKYNNEWESVTYDYYVDSVYSILVLKYAVVLEDPGHPKREQPHFTKWTQHAVVRTSTPDVLPATRVMVGIMSRIFPGRNGQLTESTWDSLWDSA